MAFLIRPAQNKDLHELLKLASYFPLSALFYEEKNLVLKLKNSQDSFLKQQERHKRNYLFVLEHDKKIIGSSQIIFHENKNQKYYVLNTKEPQELYLKSLSKPMHQIAGLILDPSYRKNQFLLGLQLTSVCLLYIKMFPKDFADIINVSLTGPLDKGISLFWKESNQAYTKLSYSQAFAKLRHSSSEFFSLFSEDRRIPLSQLSDQAKKCITQVHEKTEPVRRGLLKRGFHQTNYHHPLDGGMHLESLWADLPFLKQAKICQVCKSTTLQQASLFLLAQNVKSQFVCSLVKGEMQGDTLQVQDLAKDFTVTDPGISLKFPF